MLPFLWTNDKMKKSKIGGDFMKDKKLILVFFGSPRRKGYTVQLLSEFLKDFKN